MGTKSRDTVYGSAIRISAEKAAKARRDADAPACAAWNYRMLGYKGPAQPSPMLGDALNARLPVSRGLGIHKDASGCVLLRSPPG